MTTAAAKTVQIDVDELAELRKLQASQVAKKAKSQARSKARQELIRRHKPDYDRLFKEYGGE